MVCGRLPFGDDSQVKKLQSRQLTFTRAVSFGKDINIFWFLSPVNYWLERKILNCLMMCFRDCLIPFSLPAECRKFVCSLLQCCVGERLSSSVMLYEMWPNIQPINRPSPLMPSMIPKYTIEKCLPPHIAFPIITPVPAPALVASTPIHLLPKDTSPQRTVSSSTSQSSSSKTSKPLVMKIGACGRKIADAVKQVGHHKTECSERATN